MSGRVFYEREDHMARSLKDKDTDRLAGAIAAPTGETLTEAARVALAERLECERLRRGESRRIYHGSILRAALSRKIHA